MTMLTPLQTRVKNIQPLSQVDQKDIKGGVLLICEEKRRPTGNTTYYIDAIQDGVSGVTKIM